MNLRDIGKHLRNIDHNLRQTNICDTCGKPKDGILFQQGQVKGHGGGKGTSHYKPETYQTKAQAGLCTCDQSNPSDSQPSTVNGQRPTEPEVL